MASINRSTRMSILGQRDPVLQNTLVNLFAVVTFEAVCFYWHRTESNPQMSSGALSGRQRNVVRGALPIETILMSDQ